ncbi:MAG TPA: hypothetical protein H9867_07505 [Candidatus Corynebacterium gallistercoris]|uniref:Uncharacterized protein n=1 Tax=Candidatus Corynebacterium gallistercoris TaxID=2838530 RepID=A0A9D1UQG9_9CORY|nr:hypothetical protein [Candidatus Corynebacterium gallistercoris]
MLTILQIVGIFVSSPSAVSFLALGGSVVVMGIAMASGPRPARVALLPGVVAFGLVVAGQLDGLPAQIVCAGIVLLGNARAVTKLKTQPTTH